MILVVTSLHLGASTEGAGKLSEEDTNIVTEHTGAPALKRQRQGSWLIGLTSFLFILLQSACTAVMAISGLRLLIGLGSLEAHLRAGNLNNLRRKELYQNCAWLGLCNGCRADPCSCASNAPRADVRNIAVIAVARFGLYHMYTPSRRIVYLARVAQP